jgi:hypothetical protein
MSKPKFQPKTDKQSDFVKETKALVAQGEGVVAAAKVAAEEVYGDKYQASRLLKNPTILDGLGIDDPAVADWFKQKITKRLEDVEERGEFPLWLDDPALNPGERVKARLDYYKSIKADAATVNLVKTERRINETEDTKHRTDEEIRHRIKFGKWPEQMEIDGEPGKPN